jgi:hypothetical protein
VNKFNDADYRMEAFHAINTERDYQDYRWGEKDALNPPSVATFLAYIQNYVTEGIHQVTKQDNDAHALDTIRKIAALGVACMEYHGAPVRPYTYLRPEIPEFYSFNHRRNIKRGNTMYLAVDRAQLISDLKQNVAEIQFEKVDGSKRTMICTLQSRYLPEKDRKQINEVANREGNADIVTVWDLQANDWRSFRLDWIYSVQSKDGY